MDANDNTDKKRDAADDETAGRIDAAVKKAEDAERRMRGAEDGPLRPLSAPDEFVEPNPDQPGATAGGPG